MTVVSLVQWRSFCTDTDALTINTSIAANASDVGVGMQRVE